jgi:hypothetical protein
MVVSLRNRIGLVGSPSHAVCCDTLEGRGVAERELARQAPVSSYKRVRFVFHATTAGRGSAAGLDGRAACGAAWRHRRAPDLKAANCTHT